MATFGEMQSAVSKRLLDSANLAASALDVASALNDAVRYWKNTRLWFNEGVSSQTMVANDATIPLPSLFFSFRPMKAALLSSHTPDRGILLRRFQGLNMTLLWGFDLWASLRLCLCWWVLRGLSNARHGIHDHCQIFERLYRHGAIRLQRDERLDHECAAPSHSLGLCEFDRGTEAG